LSRRKIRRAPETGGNSAGWLTTFNDLVTLLMVFFVLLFTMGSMDHRLIKEFQYALQSGLGILEAGSMASIEIQQPLMPMAQQGRSTRPIDAPTPQDGSVEANVNIEAVLEEFAARRRINVKYAKDGVHISFEDGLFFNFGKADINPSGFDYLGKLAQAIHKLPYAVRVEGHTDNVPIRTNRFPSNWELSIARAVSVVKYFIDVGKINPRRLSAAGYGDSKPLVPNDAPATRARNRRVEIVLVTEGEITNVK